MVVRTQSPFGISTSAAILKRNRKLNLYRLRFRCQEHSCPISRLSVNESGRNKQTDSRTVMPELNLAQRTQKNNHFPSSAPPTTQHLVLLPFLYSVLTCN